jgi:hypothetical protein
VENYIRHDLSQSKLCDILGKEYLRKTSPDRKKKKHEVIKKYLISWSLRYLCDKIPRRGGIDEGENDLPGGEQGGGWVTVQHLHREQLRLGPARYAQPPLYLCNT